MVCFGGSGTKSDRKKNLRKFSGFANNDVKMKDQMKTKLLDNKKKWTVSLLKDCLGIFGCEKSGSRDELVQRLVNYVARPEVGPI